MTVKELIKLLEKCDPDKRIWYPGQTTGRHQEVIEEHKEFVALDWFEVVPGA